MSTFRSWWRWGDHADLGLARPRKVHPGTGGVQGLGTEGLRGGGERGRYWMDLMGGGAQPAGARIQEVLNVCVFPSQFVPPS